MKSYLLRKISKLIDSFTPTRHKHTFINEQLSLIFNYATETEGIKLNQSWSKNDTVCLCVCVFFKLFYFE